MMKPRLGGMSLIEVVISISILSIAALAIVLTLTRLMVAQNTSTYHTVARLIAESELEKAALAGAGSWDFTVDPPILIAKARVGQIDEEVEFRYQIFATWISSTNESGTELFEAGPEMGRLAELEVRIWWNSETAGEGAVERGIETLSVSAMVYDET